MSSKSRGPAGADRVAAGGARVPAGASVAQALMPRSQAQPEQVPSHVFPRRAPLGDPVTEVLNTVDTGTSILLDAQVRSDFVADTALEAVAHLVQQQGVPQQVTVDHDTRFVGSASARDFPSAFVRFWLCLGVQVQVCLPHHPQQNGFVERYHRTYQEECLRVYQPATEEQVGTITTQFQRFYNEERPVRHEVAHHEWNSDKSMPLNPGLCPSLFPITTCILGNRIV